MKRDVFLLGIFNSFMMFSQEPLKCNGYAELCDRRYNEIAQINSHNATSNTFSLVQDQDRSIAQQLADGIRVFKIPLHFDYGNVLDYYEGILKIYREALEKQIYERTEYLKNKRITFQTYSAGSLKKDLEKVQKEINNLKKWYAGLPDFSIQGDSKTLRALDYGARLAMLEGEKGMLSLKNADFTPLTSNPTLDPQLLELKAERLIVNSFLEQIKSKGGQEIFICHGLGKGELYRNPFGTEEDIVNHISQAPSSLKPALKKALTFIGNLPPQFFTRLYGTANPAEGGLLPYTPCVIDPSKVLLKDFLREIYVFLESNPHEVITLKLDDFLYNAKALAEVFKESGLLKYAYAHDKNQPWPTLRALIKSKKRLLVFTNGGNVEEEYPWLLNQKYYTEGWDMKWNFKTVDALINPSFLMEWGKMQYQDAYPYNKILDVTHTVTPRLAGNKETAAIINARPILRERMKLIAEQLNHIPNWISLDFYQYPHYEAFEVVEELNGVGKYKGKPLWQEKPRS